MQAVQAPVAVSTAVPGWATGAHAFAAAPGPHQTRQALSRGRGACQLTPALASSKAPDPRFKSGSSRRSLCEPVAWAATPRRTAVRGRLRVLGTLWQPRERAAWRGTEASREKTVRLSHLQVTRPQRHPACGLRGP